MTIDIWLLKLKWNCSHETDAAKGPTAFHMAKFEIKLLRIAPADLVSLPLWVKKAVFDFASHKDTVGICKKYKNVNQPLAPPMCHTYTLLNTYMQNFPTHGRRSASPIASSSEMASNKSMRGTNLATSSVQKVLIVSSTLMQKTCWCGTKIPCWCGTRNLFDVEHWNVEVTSALIDAAVEHTYSLQHNVVQAALCEEIEELDVEGLRLMTTMTQLPSILGPNYQQHPLDVGSFFPFALIMLTSKSPIMKVSGKIILGENLDRWVNMNSSS